MDSIFNDYFKKRIEHKSEILEKETLFGILEIIDKMHKHAIKDYIHSINDYSTDDGQVKSEIEFKKIYSEQFHLMFDNISEDFKLRLKDLKRELMKRLDIKKQVITEENESDNESDNKSDHESNSESDNESENEPNAKNRIFKCSDGNFRYLGPSIPGIPKGSIIKPFGKWTNKSIRKLPTIKENESEKLCNI